MILFLLLITIQVRAQEVKLSTREKPRQFEAYVGVSNYSTTSGFNRLIDLSRRVTFVYGLSYSRFHQPVLQSESLTSFRFRNSFNVPLEFRYYVLPKENRLTAFMYGRVNNSFFDMQDYQPRIEAGAALEYKVSDRSSVFLRASYSPNFFNSNGAPSTR